MTIRNKLYHMQKMSKKKMSKTMNVNNREDTFKTAILTVLVLAVLITLAHMPSSAQSHQDKSNHYRQVLVASPR
jgi:fucose permease